jgi:hypothetical protein
MALLPITGLLEGRFLINSTLTIITVNMAASFRTQYTVHYKNLHEYYDYSGGNVSNNNANKDYDLQFERLAKSLIKNQFKQTDE